MIEVKEISKKFGDQQVLDKVSISCEKGSINGIIGRNGSGKSVLLKCICGFFRQDEGKIYICGKQNTEFVQAEYRLGAIIEAPAFLDSYSGFKNLMLLYGVLNRPDKEHLEVILKAVGLDPHLKKPVKKYSMGMKQRLAIAQAIMENQDILLLDEPMNNLDIEGVTKIRNLLLKLREEGKTILMTTHNEDDVAQLCDYVYEMREGRLKRI